MPDVAKRDDARLPERVGILPADSEERLSAVVATFLGEPRSAAGGTGTFRAWVAALPADELAQARGWIDLSHVEGELPPRIASDARSFALIPVKDSSGLVFEDERGLGLGLCVSATLPREWTPTELVALEAIATMVASEVQLRRDVARRDVVAERLRRYPLHDPVTDLANRELFLDRVVQALMRNVRQPDRHLAVMSVAVDQFADIETSFGYDTAQEILKELAHRLRVAVRTVDSVARVSGAEYGILLESLRDDSDAARVATRIHDALRSPIRSSWDEFMVSASIGVVISTKGIDSPGRLLQLATLARERASATGTAYELFDPGMHKKAQTRLQREMELRRGIEAGELELHYQPIISLRTGHIVELEALLRWRHPRHGLVAAADFIGLAEETGLVLPMGWSALTLACEQLRQWRADTRENDDLAVSINMTAAHLAHRELHDKMRSALSASGLPPRALHLEITEGLLIGDPERAKQVLNDLRGLGVGIHIDDFGTGYSSLQYLHELPLDAIKIDRRFIARLGGNSREAQVAATIRELARQIGVPVIAEGVETAEQLAQVRALGCEFGQGYLFSHPLPPQDIAGFLRSHPTW